MLLKKRIIGLAICMLVFDVVAALVFISSTPVKPSEAAATEAVWKGIYSVDKAVEGTANLNAIHNRPEEHTSAECIACHGVMDAQLPSAATNKSNLKIDVHFHLKTPVARFNCIDCHQKDRVWRGTFPGKTTQLLRINRNFCFKCHGKFDVYVQKGSMQADYQTRDCRMCHVGKMAPKHAQPFLSQVLSSTECLMCHGNNVFPWPTQHYTAAWSTVHGKYAGDRKVCSSCHNLAVFCTQCHLTKPSTHDSNWRAVHKTLYKAEPQRCATCHTAEWCNTKCHLVSHTADWRNVHNAYVTDHGRDVCMKCHYLGFCMGCHSTRLKITTIKF